MIYAQFLKLFIEYSGAILWPYRKPKILYMFDTKRFSCEPKFYKLKPTWLTFQTVEQSGSGLNSMCSGLLLCHAPFAGNTSPEPVLLHCKSVHWIIRSPFRCCFFLFLFFFIFCHYTYQNTTNFLFLINWYSIKHGLQNLDYWVDFFNIRTVRSWSELYMIRTSLIVSMRSWL